MYVKRRDLERELRRIAKAHGLELVITEGGNHSKASIGTWSEPLPGIAKSQNSSPGRSSAAAKPN